MTGYVDSWGSLHFVIYVCCLQVQCWGGTCEKNLLYKLEFWTQTFNFAFSLHEFGLDLKDSNRLLIPHFCKDVYELFQTSSWNDTSLASYFLLFNCTVLCVLFATCTTNGFLYKKKDFYDFAGTSSCAVNFTISIGYQWFNEMDHLVQQEKPVTVTSIQSMGFLKLLVPVVVPKVNVTCSNFKFYHPVYHFSVWLVMYDTAKLLC